ncbi:MAG: CDP-alcohol phosphatidyltransferase family protein [Treponema sp.]|jgi:CDP-diacylglycerol--glycerol-3-phosphate 3-phosphatidyltransferase|nr:CDP-alcohol phosphatidyltransferase family protein [Treponema sp.]
MEELRASGLKKRLPNIISCARIIGAFALPFLMWKNWEINFSLPFINKTFSNVPVVWIIAYLILLSADKLDGTLARRLKAESDLGAALDSIGDVLVLVMGATLCFVRFVGDNLETWQFWLYVGMMALTVLNKVLVFILARFYHGKGNMVHTYFQKLFAASCYVGIFFWAFLRTIPEWSICCMLAINIYATIDESIYCVRAEEYNVDFKGHGFEKYKKREKITG